MKHENLMQENDFFGKGKISRILLQIAPPVMLAQLIQALYNIVDSFFVGQYRACDQLQLYPSRLPPLPGYGEVFGHFFIDHHGDRCGGICSDAGRPYSHFL